MTFINKGMFFLLLVMFFAASPVIAQKTITISAPPSIWIQEDGDNLKGPIIDILVGIFSEDSVAIKTEKLPWARAINHIETGRLDLIPVIFYTAERAEKMAFSVPYVEVATVVFVAKGKSFAFKQLDDLIDRKGLIMRRDSISPEFEDFRFKLDITEVSDYKTIMKMLSAGRVDYAICPLYGFLVAAEKHGYEDEIESLKVPVASRDIHMAISKKSPFIDYLPKINARLRILKTDGTVAKIVKELMDSAKGM